MKKTVKILVVAMILLIALTATVNAASSGVAPGSYTGGGASVDSINNVGNQIIQIVSTIGSIASVIVLVVLGLKYMMGSAEEKAEYKKTMMPYIVGAALIFAASAFAQVIYQFFTGVTAG